MNCESREKVAYGEQVFQFGNFERTFSSGFTMSVGEEEQQNTEHGFTIANKVHFINLSFEDFGMLDTDSTKGLYVFNSQRNERNSSVGIVFTCVRRSESVETSFTVAKDTLALALNFEEPRTEIENALFVEDKNVFKFYISTVGQGVPGRTVDVVEEKSCDNDEKEEDEEDDDDDDENVEEASFEDKNDCDYNYDEAEKEEDDDADDKGDDDGGMMVMTTTTTTTTMMMMMTTTMKMTTMRITWMMTKMIMMTTTKIKVVAYS
ncbi:conserved hypothetical protein [Trichinella spiralis]|uniref:hypothetical protein n=1 Tax=Trichinella spiralis TaxID=6334 RepID=UPI0001EFE33B|nr:conserved hypothetical protein [Trichinella spiralis]